MTPPHNKSLESSLDQAKSKNFISHVTQFAYDNPITTVASPFEVKPRQPSGTLPFSYQDRKLDSIGTHKHPEVSRQSQASDNPYKTQANSNYMKFQVGDYVMVPIRQLQTCSTRSLKVSKRVGQNSYIKNFPTDYKGNSTFNTVNLVTYKGPAVYDFPHDLCYSAFDSSNTTKHFAST